MKVIDPATLVGMRVRAGYCEGVHCCEPDGETRAYPLLFNVKSAFVILCRPCWEHENRYRQERGKELGCPEHWPTRNWDAAERYQPLRLSAETTAIAVLRSGPAAKRSSASKTTSSVRLAA